MVRLVLNQVLRPSNLTLKILLLFKRTLFC